MQQNSEFETYQLQQKVRQGALQIKLFSFGNILKLQIKDIILKSVNKNRHQTITSVMSIPKTPAC